MTPRPQSALHFLICIAMEIIIFHLYIEVDDINLHGDYCSNGIIYILESHSERPFLLFVRVPPYNSNIPNRVLKITSSLVIITLISCSRNRFVCPIITDNISFVYVNIAAVSGNSGAQKKVTCANLLV